MSGRRREILDILAAVRSAIAERHGVRLVGLVGSWARDEALAGSDVDIAYERIAGRAISFFDLGRASADLEDALGEPVDLVDWERVRDAFRPTMERDLVRLGS